MLLLADGKTDLIRAGDVVRTPAGEVHGVMNSGNEPFMYLAVTGAAWDPGRARTCDLLLRSQPDAHHPLTGHNRDTRNLRRNLERRSAGSCNA
jgi:uncharacterized cupin superfamily protein